MNRVLLLVGSPRGRKSASTLLGGYLSKHLEEKGWEAETLWLIKHFSNPEKMDVVLEAIGRADVVVLAAPLYDDCQPYIVVKTMEAISSMGEKIEKKRFFTIINCGFGESVHITEVSISLYKKFATDVGFEWAGSLAVGGGEMLRAREGRTLEDLGSLGKKLRLSLESIAGSLSEDRKESDRAFEFPRIFMNRLFMWMGNKMWKSRAKKNGAAVDARPYAR